MNCMSSGNKNNNSKIKENNPINNNNPWNIIRIMLSIFKNLINNMMMKTLKK